MVAVGDDVACGRFDPVPVSTTCRSGCAIVADLEKKAVAVSDHEDDDRTTAGGASPLDERDTTDCATYLNVAPLAPHQCSSVLLAENSCPCGNHPARYRCELYDVHPGS